MDRGGRLTKVILLLLGVLLVSVLLYETVPSKRLLSHIAKPEQKDETPHPKYKPTPTPAPPIVDNFPLAVEAHSSADLPPVPSWNAPPSPHVQEYTPLLIGFTRNWRLLQQTVVSYITAGWPPEDIYVVENTGTMRANRNGNLTLQNPFYLDYRRLTEVFGVNVLSTPALLTFAQLQNFYLHTAIENDWEYYFWGHMDVVALSREDWDAIPEEDGPYKSLYTRCVEDMRQTTRDKYVENKKGKRGEWGIRFYAYDRLALVNRDAFEKVGGWDELIPYYGTDCDMHSRLAFAGYMQTDGHVGLVYDIGDSIQDLVRLYRRRPQSPEDLEPPTHASLQPEDMRGSQEWANLRDQLNSMSINKNSRDDRNSWQGKQTGGQGEPFYRDPVGFQKAITMWQDFGQKVMHEKWGHRGCDLGAVGLKGDDAWKVEHDWD